GSETINGTVNAGKTGTVTLTAAGAASDVAVNGTVGSAGGAINVKADQDVLINDKVDGTNGAITAQAGRDITISSDVQTTGKVSLTAGGAIAETDKGRILDGALLTTDSVTGQKLDQANTVKSFAAENKTNGDIEFTNAADTLTIKNISQANGKVAVTNTGALITGTGGTVKTTDGNISLTAAGGSETINGTVSAGKTGMVTLTATGAESDVAVNGTVTSAGGAIDLAAAQDVLVNAKVNGTDGDITAQAGRDITINNDVQTTGNVSLSADGAIAETDSGKILEAALLTTDSVTGQSLASGNTVESFNAVNTREGDILFVNTVDDLNVTGIKQTGRGNVILRNMGDISVDTIAARQDVSLTAAGSIKNGLPEDSDNIEAVNLTLTAQTGSVGASNRYLYIDSSKGSDGVVTANAATGIYLNETKGSLNLNKVMTTSGSIALAADQSIVNRSADGSAVIGGKTAVVSLTAQNGGIGEENARMTSAAAKLNVLANGNIYLEQTSGDLIADFLVSQAGSMDLLVPYGTIRSERIFAADLLNLNVRDNMNLEDIEAGRLNVQLAPGSVLNLGQTKIAKSVNARADKMYVSNLIHTGSEPLHLTMTGSSGNMADTITVNATSSAGIIFDKLSAITSSVTAQVDNLSIVEANVGDIMTVKNSYHSVIIDKTPSGLVAANVQLYPETLPVYLYLSQENKVFTDARIVQYQEGYIVNNFSTENSMVRLTEKMMQVQTPASMLENSSLAQNPGNQQNNGQGSGILGVQGNVTIGGNPEGPMSGAVVPLSDNRLASSPSGAFNPVNTKLSGVIKIEEAGNQLGSSEPSVTVENETSNN
ncbi:MAG: hypothetical protein ABFC84_02345, partial [Veillonellales bacterium]